MKKFRMLSLILSFAMVFSLFGFWGSKSYAYEQDEIDKALGIIYQDQKVTMQGIRIKENDISGDLITDNDLSFTLFDATIQEPCGTLTATDGILESVDLIKGHHYIIWLNKNDNWSLKNSVDSLGPGKRYFSLNQDVDINTVNEYYNLVAASESPDPADYFSTLPRDDKNFDSSFVGTPVNADVNPSGTDYRKYMCCLVLESGSTGENDYKVPVGLDSDITSSVSGILTVITEDGDATNFDTQEDYDISDIDPEAKIELINQYEKIIMEQDDYKVDANVQEDLNYAVVLDGAGDDFKMLSSLLTVKDHSEQGTKKRLTYSHYTCVGIKALFFASPTFDYYEYTAGLELYNDAIENCTYEIDSYSASDLSAKLEGIVAITDTGLRINGGANDDNTDEFLFIDRKLNNYPVNATEVSGKEYDVIDFDTINMHRYEISKLPYGDYTITTKLPEGRSASAVTGVYNIGVNGEIYDDVLASGLQECEIVGSDGAENTITFNTQSVGCYNTVIVYSSSAVEPESIAVTPKTVNMKVGDKKEFKDIVSVAYTPTESEINKEITYTTGSNIVRIDNTAGTITALAEGSATITATTENGKTDTFTVVVSKADDGSGSGLPDLSHGELYRFSRPDGQDWLITGNKQEIEKLLDAKWTFEGLVGRVGTKDTGIAVKRFYNKYTGDRMYTSNEEEIQNYIDAEIYGWVNEGTAFYTGTAKEVVRYITPYSAHLWSVSKIEQDTLDAHKDEGWVNEGIAFYLN